MIVRLLDNNYCMKQIWSLPSCSLKFCDRILILDKWLPDKHTIKILTDTVNVKSKIYEKEQEGAGGRPPEEWVGVNQVMSGERWALPRWSSVCGLVSEARKHWAHVGSNRKAFLGEPAMLPDEPWQTEVAAPFETESGSVLLRSSSKWKNLHGPETSLFWKVTFCFLKCSWARFLDCPFSFLFIPSLTYPKIFFWAHITYQALGYNWDRHTKFFFFWSNFRPKG